MWRRAVGLDVGGVDDGEQAPGEALAGDGVEEVEGVVAGALVVVVVGDEAAAMIGAEDLGGLEVLAGEGCLARAGGADEGDDGEVGDLELHGHGHRRNTPIWVGAPSSGSTGPIAVSSTA
jgi:hypothetical protein